MLVSLPGHTRGHAAVAVNAGSIGGPSDSGGSGGGSHSDSGDGAGSGDRWILHAGDAFYHHGTLDGRTKVPAILRTFETLVAYDLPKVRDNHARLVELHRRGEPDLLIVSAHDGSLLESARTSA